MLHLLGLLYSAAAAVAAATLFSEDVQGTTGAITLPTTTETLLVVGQALTLPSTNAKAVIRAWCELTPGTGTTAVTIAIYAGTVIGGRLVGAKTPLAGEFAPGSTALFTIEVLDSIANAGSAQYCMSITQVGATANGSVVSALLDTSLLSG